MSGHTLSTATIDALEERDAFAVRQRLAAVRGYTCHRAERAAGFRHGDGVRKTRQDWSLGATVNVGFVRNLTVIRTPAMGYRDGAAYELAGPNGIRYGFEPHLGLFRLDGR